MDRPLTLTLEQLDAILLAVSHRATHLNLHGKGILQDHDVKGINDELALTGVIGPSVHAVIDISNPHGSSPGHLASTLNGYGNDLVSINEGIKKLDGTAQKVADALTSIAAVLVNIEGAVSSLSDANILAQPLPPEVNADDALYGAADRIVQLLTRRPDLLQIVREKLDAQ
jgi:hypothetical protein